MRLPLPVFVPIALAIAAATPAHTQSIAAAEPTPRAAHSLLLDIARAGPRLVVAGERGQVLYSDDDGQSWLPATVPVSAMLTAVFFADPQHGWAVGHDGMIVASSDGGANWALQRDGLIAQRELDRRAVEQARTRVAELAAVASDEDEALSARLDQAGLDLEQADAVLGEPVAPPPLFDVHFGDLEHGIAVGASGSLLVTGDGGRSWIDARERLRDADRRHLYAITALANRELLIAGEAGQVFHSSDGGQSWEARSTGRTDTLFGLVPEGGERALYAFGLRGALLYSGDAGTSWIELVSPTRTLLGGGMAVDDGSVWIVGSMGTLLHVRAGSIELRTGSARHSNLSAVVMSGAGKLIAVGEAGIEPLESDGGER